MFDHFTTCVKGLMKFVTEESDFKNVLAYLGKVNSIAAMAALYPQKKERFRLSSFWSYRNDDMPSSLLA